MAILHPFVSSFKPKIQSDLILSLQFSTTQTDLVTVHSTGPCPGFAARRSQIRDSAPAEALLREEADFDFRLVEPTSVLRGEVNREAIPNLAAYLHSEGVGE
jgi:hypothetical protein